MKLLLICCLLSTALAGSEKKISLEDIERDNLTSERSPSSKVPSIAQSPTNYGFVPVRTATSYEQTEPKVQYVTPAQPQPQQQYYQPSYQEQASYYAYQPQQAYKQYENVQYVTDNSIQAQPQYYAQQPQYYYVQQPSSSNEVQTFVNPKEGVQYIMFIPTYVPQSQVAQQPEVVPEETYVAPAKPQVQYQVPTYVRKGEPKSLLDSYVPSILQVQYYNKQNSIPREPAVKYSTASTGKSQYVKGISYVAPQTQETRLKETYQYPSAYRYYKRGL